MPIYAKSNNNEYNKIIDIFDTNGIDITDVYYDDQLVYTVSKDILGSTELYYNTNRYDITNFRVYGNTFQDGTPSPDAPVDVQGVGERTGNLFDADANDTDKGYVYNKYLRSDGETTSSPGWRISEYIEISESALYTIFYNGSYNAPSVCFYDNDKGFISGSAYSGKAAVTIGSPIGTKYCRFSFRDTAKERIMLNLGSTALPYEPYGFKLSPTVNSVEYPIYLGTAPTTRRVKKLVLTGDDGTWQKSNTRISSFFLRLGNVAIPGFCICDRAVNAQNAGEYSSSGKLLIERSGPNILINMWLFDTDISVDDFKSYLAQQYANGTPVTVWYVLATPETAVVNEPLMKIGDYADSINIIQSNPQLKLDIGENNIFIPTTVPPSNMELQAKGGISVSGTSSLQITRKSEYLSDYKISGNTVQDGTPSADAPVDAVGSGVRTGNLAPPLSEFIRGYVDVNGNIHNASGIVQEKSSEYIQITPNTDYVFAFQNGDFPTGEAGAWRAVGIYDENKTFIKRVGGNVSDPLAFNSGANAKFARLSYRSYGSNLNTMLNLGSTALPYEPYGFKLPLTVNSVAYPIYLGTVPTTRKIKKLMLTGKENFGFDIASGTKVMVISDHLQLAGIVGCLCSHYIAAQNTTGGYSTLSDLHCAMRAINKQFWIRDRSLSPDDFKSYLAQQYAAGTPVTVWYVLAEPETAVVNEPLMKIGDYADTVSAAQAGVTIPTVSGENVLDTTSTVKPSEVYIKGKGIKPTGYGQLTDVNGVNILDKDGKPIYVHGQ